MTEGKPRDIQSFDSGKVGIKEVDLASADFGDLTDVFNPDGSINTNTQNASALESAQSGLIVAQPTDAGGFRVFLTKAGIEALALIKSQRGIFERKAGNTEEKELGYQQLAALAITCGFKEGVEVVKKANKQYIFYVRSPDSQSLIEVGLRGTFQELQVKLQALRKVAQLLETVGLSNRYKIIDARQDKEYSLYVYPDFRRSDGSQTEGEHTGTASELWNWLRTTYGVGADDYEQP